MVYLSGISEDQSLSGRSEPGWVNSDLLIKFDQKIEKGILNYQQIYWNKFIIKQI